MFNSKTKRFFCQLTRMIKSNNWKIFTQAEFMYRQIRRAIFFQNLDVAGLDLWLSNFDSEYSIRQSVRNEWHFSSKKISSVFHYFLSKLTSFFWNIGLEMIWNLYFNSFLDKYDLLLHVSNYLSSNSQKLF